MLACKKLNTRGKDDKEGVISGSGFSKILKSKLGIKSDF